MIISLPVQGNRENDSIVCIVTVCTVVSLFWSWERCASGCAALCSSEISPFSRLFQTAVVLTVRYSGQRIVHDVSCSARGVLGQLRLSWLGGGRLKPQPGYIGREAVERLLNSNPNWLSTLFVFVDCLSNQPFTWLILCRQ